MISAKSSITVAGKTYTYYRLKSIEEEGIASISRLPFSIRVLVENILRKMDGKTVSGDDLVAIANWKVRYDKPKEIAYFPSRVLLQDFTGVPCVVDLASMRDAMLELGGDAMQINPLIPVDLVIDHSIQVDYHGSGNAMKMNMDMEYKRNTERYTFLKWAQKSFKNMRIFPPGTGIVHQVNLEYISTVVMTAEDDDGITVFPDTLIGTDSHTTMINGLGVLGWGVGGIEAEAVMLGQPYYMAIPEVVGVNLHGELPEGSTATDLVLTITELLRSNNVVGKFVEYSGPGIKSMSLPDRAMLANMAPEYGATTGFFPVDEETIRYLRLTNRGESADLVESYTKEQGLFYYGDEKPEYSKIIELDMSMVKPSLAGPSRPQDRIPVSDMKKRFSVFLSSRQKKGDDIKSLSAFGDESGHDEAGNTCKIEAARREIKIEIKGEEMSVCDGSVVIAAITSCTSTSNPSAMIGAGIMAKNAVEKGLRVKPYVKTSLAPGSGVVLDYLGKSGLLKSLEDLGFFTVGIGCTTCIGNSGPLHPEIERVANKEGLIFTSVLSGNRNFEARIHQNVKANYLASPALVVAFAIAGRADIDLTTEPLGTGVDGKQVYLSDIWPSDDEVSEIMSSLVTPDIFKERYRNAIEGDSHWKSLPSPEGKSFKWNISSTYIKSPPFFRSFKLLPVARGDIDRARALLLLGDSVTTDHISPAGAIPEDYPAGQYLISENVSPSEFNTYGSRRGNHEVMLRGTFANVRIKNMLVAPKEGGFTLKFPEREEVFTYNAAMRYIRESRPLVVIAGKEYGTGSSRDWAAKGTHLLGIRAVIAESYERIHRSNLVGMGVLPLEFSNGTNWKSLGLYGGEEFCINGISDIAPEMTMNVDAIKENGDKVSFEVTVRLDTGIEVEYYHNGGILPFVLRMLANT